MLCSSLLLCTRLPFLFARRLGNHLLNDDLVFFPSVKAVGIRRETSSRVGSTLVRIVGQFLDNLISCLIEVIVVSIGVHLFELPFGPRRKLFPLSSGAKHKAIFDDHPIVCRLLYQTLSLSCGATPTSHWRSLLIISTLHKSHLRLDSPLICLIFDLFDRITSKSVHIVQRDGLCDRKIISLFFSLAMILFCPSILWQHVGTILRGAPNLNIHLGRVWVAATWRQILNLKI